MAPQPSSDEQQQRAAAGTAIAVSEDVSARTDLEARAENVITAISVAGTEREMALETAVVCSTCTGQGTAPGTHPSICDTCQGRGGGMSVAEVEPLGQQERWEHRERRPARECGRRGAPPRYQLMRSRRAPGRS